MAKRKSNGFMTTVFYIILSIMAMNFLAVVILAGAQVYMGKLTQSDLLDLMQVLAGKRKFSMTTEQIQEYRDLKKQAEADEKERLVTDGSPETQIRSAQALDTQKKVLEARAATLREMIQKESEKLKALRATIEQTAEQAKKEEKRLADIQAESLKKSQDKNTQEMIKMFKAMDPGDIATFMTTQMTALGPSDGPPEVARYLRDYVTPQSRAEVFAEMQPNETRQILPLLEDEYAGWSEAKIVEEWTRRNGKHYQTTRNISDLLKKMTVPKALRILMLLPVDIRAQVVQILQKPAPQR